MLEMTQERMNSYIKMQISQIDATIAVIASAINRAVAEREAAEQLFVAFECSNINETKSSNDNSQIELLRKFINELLTEKEQKVVLLYYYEELTLKEISHVLEVSESRISQLHTKALKKMKKKMGNYLGILSY